MKVEIRKGLMLIYDEIEDPRIICVDNIVEILSVNGSTIILLDSYNKTDRVVVNCPIAQFWYEYKNAL